ncbi:hypothetical protein [Caldimonas taiwanensis]|uniref:hypothetical protein n=1 Tax=Caldimonas taiwanensis TaxID=307483 RepID=UPI000784E78F|nr:hypothetical protein [Caldimonas taiwanensis]
MHVLIPYASALTEAARAAIRDLSLPHLGRLLARLGPVWRSEGDEYSLSMPHERALALAWGYAGADGALPWAAHAAAADGIATDDLCWGLLTPAHWHAGADEVTMLPPESLQLDEAGSREALEAVRELFESEGWVLVYGAPLRWYVAHESLAELPTASLDRVIGRNVDLWMPDSPQARVVRRLQQEVQMLLYTHPLNERREAQGLLPINSFWLSGCGPRQPARPTPELIVDARLREAHLHGDWPAWAQAWQALDAGPLREAWEQVRAGHPVQLTLCGERHAHTWGQAARPWWQALRARWAAPSPVDVLLSL